MKSLHTHTHSHTPTHPHTRAHTHTHTHTCSDLQPWIWNFRNFTCNRGHFHGWTWMDFLCTCVKFYYQTMNELPPTPNKSIIGHVFLYACLCDLLPNGGSLTIMDVYGWCVSTVIQQFFLFCPWLKVLTNTNAHTHSQPQNRVTSESQN